MDIQSVQKRAWANKQAKGFNTTNVALEFGLLNAEIGEAFTAWRKQYPDLGEELADVLIYLAGLAEMTGIDLAAEVERKLAANADRVYLPDAHGILHRAGQLPARPDSDGRAGQAERDPDVDSGA